MLSEPQRLEITVHDLTGRRVATLADRPFTAGRHTVDWLGRDDDGRAVASGTYLLRVKGETVDKTRKLMLVR